MTPTKQQITSAKAIFEDLLEQHEHSDDCIDSQTLEVTYWATPDSDRSYEQEVYICKVTGEQLDYEG